jgi:hypothetical protein
MPRRDVKRKSVKEKEDFERVAKRQKVRQEARRTKPKVDSAAKPARP